MMRWSSSKTYTEEDMIRMQHEAVNRVQEFQARARQAVPFYDVPESAITPYTEPQQPEPLLFAPPALSADSQAQAPQVQADIPIPQNDAAPVTVPAQAPPKTSIVEDPIRGILEKFEMDPDITLILGLILLLHNEKADNLLLMALGYLLL